MFLGNLKFWNVWWFHIRYVRQNSETANIQNIILWFFVYVDTVAFFCICFFPLCFVCYSYIRFFQILYDYIKRCTKYIIVIMSYGRCTWPTVCYSRHAKVVVAIFIVNFINILYIYIYFCMHRNFQSRVVHVQNYLHILYIKKCSVLLNMYYYY